FAARSTRHLRSPKSMELVSTARASARALVMFEKALSKFSGPRASTNCGFIPSARAATSAAFSVSFSVRSPTAPGCQRIATRLTRGTACVRSSRHFPTSSGARTDNPVTLPPGCARLVTILLATGSATAVKTLGMVLVACLAASAAGVDAATRTSTLSATSSAARAERRGVLSLGISVLDRDVAPLDVTEVTQPLAEGLLEVRATIGPEVAYSGNLGRLLGLGCDLSSDDASAHHGDERPTVHQSLLSRLEGR